MTEAEAKALADVVRQTALQLHTYLKWGHLEKVYENGLAHRLSKKGIRIEQQIRIPVKDEDGTILGDYIADIVVNGDMILEIKACESLEDIHIAQVLGYLRVTGLRHGMLINFGNPVLQIKKLIL
jgi:GxxExxY protein